MSIQFFAFGLLVSGMCLFLALSIFLNGGASLIALALLGVAAASGIFIKHWKMFVARSPASRRRDKLISAALLLFGYSTALAAVALAIGVLWTGNLSLAVKFAGFIESLFILECAVLIAQA